MLFVMQDLAHALLDILEILILVVVLNAVLMASVPRPVHVKKENVSILVLVHAEQVQFAQSITIYRRARVLLAPQEILSICALRFKYKKVNYQLNLLPLEIGNRLNFFHIFFYLSVNNVSNIYRYTNITLFTVALWPVQRMYSEQKRRCSMLVQNRTCRISSLLSTRMPGQR